MTLKIFTDSRAQAAFLERLSAQLKKRVAEAPSKTGGAAAAAARAVQDRDVSILDVRVLQAQMLVQSGAMKPNKALAFMIGKLLGESHDDSLAVYFAHTVLSGLEVFTDEYRQELLDQVKVAYPSYHATPIGQPISFNKPTELEALITAYYKGRLPTTLTKMLKAGFSEDLAYQIAAQGIPHDFIINYEFNRCATTDEKLIIATTLEAKYGPNILTKQYAALENMEQNAHATGVTLKQGVEYFQKQYGDTRETQLAMMLAEFKETPHQVQHSGRVLRFVNQALIHLWDKCESSPKQTDITIDTCNIIRLPLSLLNTKGSLNQLVFTGLDVDTSSEVFSDIPGWFGALNSLKTLVFTGLGAYHFKYNFDFATVPDLKVSFPTPKQEDIRTQNHARIYARGGIAVANQFEFDIQDALKVFATMKANSCGPGITAERANQAFVEEFGDTPTQQLINFIRMFRMMPHPNALREAFNQSYFDFKKEIEAQDGATEIKATTELLRFIPGALKKHAATLEHLDLSGNQMRLIPLNLHETFTKLEILNITGVPLAQIPFTDPNGLMRTTNIDFIVAQGVTFRYTPKS